MTRLEQARIDAGLSRRDLAKKSGVHHATITDLEEARTVRPHATTLALLGGALELRPSELLLPALSPDGRGAA